jgi:hypothetical protein
LQQIKAIHVWHFHIQKKKLWLQRLYHLQAILCAIAGSGHIDLAAMHFQHVLQQFYVFFFIVDDDATNISHGGLWF